MPNNKKTTNTRKTGGTASKQSTQKKKTAERNAPKRKTEPKEKSSFAAQLTPYIVVVAAILITVCMLAGENGGAVGYFIHRFLKGMFGGVAFTLPLFIIWGVVNYAQDSEEGVLTKKNICISVLFASACVLLHVFAGGEDTFNPVTHYVSAQSGKGGGVLGGFVGKLMVTGFAKAGTLVIALAVIFILALYLFGITPKGLWILIRYKLKVAKEAREDARLLREADTRLEKNRALTEEREAYLREHRKTRQDPQMKMEVPEKETTRKPQRYRFKKKKVFVTDIPVEDPIGLESELVPETTETADEIDERIFEEAMRRTRERRAASREEEVEDFTRNAETAVEPGETLEPVNTVEEGKDSAAVDLKGLFVNPEDADLLDKLTEAYLNGESSGVKYSTEADGLDVVREGLGDAPEAPEVPAKKEYIFPPVSILTEDTEARDENIKEELHANAVKLVETLRSFNVKTKIENVSRGPTITRYELLPEAGIRVRSILNLVDDISLNLATTGVRIEAPIPGKPAVGIEVPNKKRATVHLRTLVEDERFESSPSKLLCALGEDVGGEGVYLDISKMPHLLIAGATGMGKSVCINSLIVSLLFNATPEEVKLILIDPKKVELNVYNGIPHLLVPVVSDPKKAAGSLSWAVSEMERRFGLIESVGVRDINMYNKVTENDPAYEFLPYIVIIIDELADLMMTAPDDVEESVCRLMQKARAAGMHVIIGTQRPSVDVITGLIKANIPSRIAFTVASQVDSRTIIDRAGAESLIGRGDMLFIPVGASKPIRVQGAFVSEEDVEKVVTYIKNANAGAEVEYASEVIEQIEKEAAKCGMSKKSAAAAGAVDGEGEDDPMLRSALELAVNSGKISTSLIQRRLSLGYGRAGKLIDRMEQLGYVSAPDGQKPREVLISKEQFMEMVLKNDDDII